MDNKISSFVKAPVKTIKKCIPSKKNFCKSHARTLKIFLCNINAYETGFIKFYRNSSHVIFRQKFFLNREFLRQLKITEIPLFLLATLKVNYLSASNLDL